MVVIHRFLSFYCCYLLLGGAVSIKPVVFPVHISSDGDCSHNEHPQTEQLMQALRESEQKLSLCQSPSNRSCHDIVLCYPSASSGYYNLRASNGSLVRVYCDMEGTNCDNKPGWTRVAYLDMTQPGATCPEVLTTSRNVNGKDLCYRSDFGCDSIVYSTLGLRYSEVCGRVRGYQYLIPNAFGPYLNGIGTTIDSTYVDGVSITYGGSPRKHIWTYAAGSWEDGGDIYNCPCYVGSTISAPYFVGNDYYCESGMDLNETCPVDPLWDGQCCGNREGPCCSHPNMPWFVRTLSENTTESVELRVCGNGGPQSENTPMELIELFIR